jgi:hypothetical protein
VLRFFARAITFTATLVMLIGVTDAADASPASSPHWRVSYSSPLLHSSFGDVIALSARDVWAVGGVYPGNAHDDRPLVRRWSGKSWTVVGLPRRYGNASLDVVAASSARNVWVYGHYLTRTRRIAFALRWDGSSWSQQASWSNNGFVLGSAVITPRNVWLYGTFGTWHFNGRRWSNVKLPFVITGMSVRGGSDIWATAYPANNNLTTLLVRWRNGHWAIRSTAPSSVAITVSNMFALSDHDIWIVGRFQRGNSFEPLAMNWAAGKWRRYRVPSVGSDLSSVVADGSGGLWAAYQFGSPYVAHFRAGHWRRVRLPLLSGQGREADALARLPRSRTVFGVGQTLGDSLFGGYAVILKYSR